MALERGIVKSYGPHRKFGFAFVKDAGGYQTDEEIFFHLHDERPVKHTTDDTSLVKARMDRHYRNYTRIPEVGEMIVFRRSEAEKGPKAIVWAYADVWDKTARYKVCATTKVGFIDPHVSACVKWEGSDTDALSIAYPPNGNFNADRLSNFREQIEDGWIRTHIHFERLTHCGAWVECEDPRYRLTPLSELELAIEAENRRRFPGDYQ